MLLGNYLVTTAGDLSRTNGYFQPKSTKIQQQPWPALLDVTAGREQLPGERKEGLTIGVIQRILFHCLFRAQCQVAHGVIRDVIGQICDKGNINKLL